MMRYRKLGYVAINVTNIERSAEFYEKSLGLTAAGPGPEGSRLFRCSSDFFNVALYPSLNPGVKRIGFEMESKSDVERVRDVFAKRGIHPQELHDREALHLGNSVRVSEPLTGATFDFYDGMNQMPTPFVPTVAKIQRLGHVVLKTENYEEARRFFLEDLNFQASDAISGFITFMRCFPNPFHHSFALTPGRAAALHHVIFMVSEFDDIGSAMSRFKKRDIPVVHGPGRHPPSGSMFLYFLDPDGLTLEYSFGMEEFPEEHARRPRMLEAIPESGDYWGSVADPRKTAVGSVERLHANVNVEGQH